MPNSEAPLKSLPSNAIFTELYDGQGLGNQLWVYAVARSLSHRLGVPFSILGAEVFKGRGFLNIDFGVSAEGLLTKSASPNSSLPPGISNYVRERYEVIYPGAVDVSRADENVLSAPPGSKIDGNLQSLAYLEKKETIRGWFPFIEGLPAAKEGLCLVHVRGGDFKNLTDVSLGFGYYNHAINHVKSLIPGAKFLAVTDDPSYAIKVLPPDVAIAEEATRKPDEYKARHHLGGPVSADFSLLSRAEAVIIPNSSFSWWAAYLNPNAKLIVAPKYWGRHNVGDGFWSTSDIITPGFSYLDKAGRVFSYEECVAEKETFYANNVGRIVEVLPNKPSFAARLIDNVYLVVLSLWRAIRNQR